MSWILARRRALAVWTAAVAVYVLAVFHRTSLSVAGLVAADRFDISASQLAVFTMVQLLVYAAMQIPVGVLLDRVGPRRMLTVGLILMTGGQLAFAMVSGYGPALGARVLVGMGDAMVFASVLRLVASWFVPARNPLVTQATGMLGQFGAIAAAVPMSAALATLGWSAAFTLTAGIGVLLGIVLFVVVRDTPLEDEPTEEPVRLAVVADGLRSSWAQPGTRLGLWTHFATMGSVTAMVLLWGYPFFVQGEGLSGSQAGVLLTLATVASLVSGPVIGSFVARHPFHRSSLVLGVVGTIVVMWTLVLAWPGTAPIWLLAGLMLVLGVGGPASMVGFDFARTFNPPDRLGGATGIVNQGGFIASLLTIVAIGFVLDWSSPGTGANYSPDAFRIAMATQYVVWAVGVVQILRYRRRARVQLATEDPDSPAAEWVRERSIADRVARARAAA
ncbi:MAG: MFS transporter [Nocardioidaceae bacterium]